MFKKIFAIGLIVIMLCSAIGAVNAKSEYIKFDADGTSHLFSYEIYGPLNQFSFYNKDITVRPLITMGVIDVKGTYTKKVNFNLSEGTEFSLKVNSKAWRDYYISNN